MRAERSVVIFGPRFLRGIYYIIICIHVSGKYYFEIVRGELVNANNGYVDRSSLFHPCFRNNNIWFVSYKFFINIIPCCYVCFPSFFFSFPFILVYLQLYIQYVCRYNTYKCSIWFPFVCMHMYVRVCIFCFYLEISSYLLCHCDLYSICYNILL